MRYPVSRHRIVVIAIFAILLGFSNTRSFAQFISSDDLFLAPTAVAEDFYDEVFLSTGGSHMFTGEDIASGFSLTGLRILPTLVANSLTTEGEYSTSDLLGVNVGNYSSYFADQPNLDYFATEITSNSSFASFNDDGFYFVELTGSDGTNTASKIVNVQINDFLGEDPAAGVKDKVAVHREVGKPTSDLVIISDGDPKDNGFNTNAQALLPDAKKAKTLEEACQAVKDAYAANGNKKISLTMMGHGRSGSIKIGTERINDFSDGTMTAQAFQECIDPYVKEITFFSCNVGAGTDGQMFLQTFANSIGKATGYDKTVTAGEKSFDLDAKAKAIVVTVPESGSGSLLIIALAAGGFLILPFRRRSVR